MTCTSNLKQTRNNSFCLFQNIIITFLHSILYWLGFSDVGMMMMQSGMVKQSVDFTSSVKAFDGTIIEKCLTYFANQNNCQPISIVSLSTFFDFMKPSFPNKFTSKTTKKKLNVFYAKRFCSTFYCIRSIAKFYSFRWNYLRMELNDFCVVFEQFESRLGINFGI